jgi:hypothetical protein
MIETKNEISYSSVIKGLPSYEMIDNPKYRKILQKRNYMD